jgi:hypothetical protein
MIRVAILPTLPVTPLERNALENAVIRTSDCYDYDLATILTWLNGVVHHLEGNSFMESLTVVQFHNFVHFLATALRAKDDQTTALFGAKEVTYYCP